MGKMERCGLSSSHPGRSRRSIRRWPKGFRRFSAAWANADATWFCSAADVAVQHELAEPETAGADRALAVAAAIGIAPRGRPGLVVSCGTAITVERISEQGIWQGGAIAPGLAVAGPRLAQSDRHVALGRTAPGAGRTGERRRGRRSRPASSGAQSARFASCSIDKRRTWAVIRG